MEESLEGSKFVRWAGIFVLLKLALWTSLRIYRIVRLYLNAQGPPNVKTYEEWAVITGCTEGIGKGYAFQLAKRGMNLILISRNEEKLQNLAKEIREQYDGVKTTYIVADFTDRDCYNHIEESIKGKDIGVLVNNVGYLRPGAVEYSSIENHTIWHDLDVNCGSVIMMTRMILPQMMLKNKGLIINMGSLASVLTIPFVGLYTASKDFINTFSATLQHELKPYNIQIRCFLPGMVNTNFSKPFFSSLVGETFNPSPETYANSALESLSENSLYSTGYWSHSILEFLIDCIPFEWRGKVAHHVINFLESYQKKRGNRMKKST